MCHPIIHFSNIAIEILDFFITPSKISLLKAIAKRLMLLFANAFKSVKERQLLLSQELEEQ